MHYESKPLSTYRAALLGFTVTDAEGGIIWNSLGRRLETRHTPTKRAYVNIKGKRYYLDSAIAGEY